MTDSAGSGPEQAGARTALLDAAESEFAAQGYAQASLRAIMRRAGTDPGAVHYHFRNRAGLAAAVLDRLLVPLNQRRLDLLTELERAAGLAPDQFGSDDRADGDRGGENAVGEGDRGGTDDRAHGDRGGENAVGEGTVLPVAGLVEALLRPDVELATALDEREQGRARLVSATYLRPADFVLTQVEVRFAPVAARFHPHLIAAIPDVAPEILGWRVRWAVFGLVGAVLADDDDGGSSGSSGRGASGGDAPAGGRPDPDELLARLVSTTVGALTAPHPAPTTTVGAP
ncbi:MAG: TetR family transcriptional regulator [Actinomycetota bacterium]